MSKPEDEEEQSAYQGVDDSDEQSLKIIDKTFSHQDAMALIKENLKVLLCDPLLCDLPADVTLDEVNSQIALEYGRSMTVNVRRADDKLYAVVVTQTATVRDLKAAIKRHVTLKLGRDTSRPQKKVSWRYVWRTYWLTFEGQKLTEESRLLKDYGIRNRDEVTFIKRLHQK